MRVYEYTEFVFNLFALAKRIYSELKTSSISARIKRRENDSLATTERW